MVITVGREPNAEKPRLRITDGSKTVFLGNPGSVSHKVSREHCRISLSGDGTISIADITEKNIMFVDGVPTKNRNGVKSDAKIELGPDHYPLDLAAVLKAFQGTLTFHIMPLGKIYNDYQNAVLNMQRKSARINALSGLTIVFTLGSTALAGFVPQARVIGIVLAVVFAVAMAAVRFIGADSNPRRKQELDESFRDEYVCPNHQCGKSLRNFSYKELLKGGSCPYCKSKYVE